jgi:DNA-3-methyladenine glycosylase
MSARPQSSAHAPDGERLQRKDFARPTFLVARRLLGCTIWHRVDGNVVRGRIVEVEVYTDDPASHAAHGKRTPRNRIMFGPAGFAYVYFTYGMHHCFNVITESDGKPGAVLVRGLDGIDHAAGPGLVCRALHLTRHDNGRDLVTDPDLWIAPGRRRAGEHLVRTRRVGIRHGADLAWRLYLLGSPGVSKRDRQAEAQCQQDKRSRAKIASFQSLP